MARGQAQQTRLRLDRSRQSQMPLRSRWRPFPTLHHELGVLSRRVALPSPPCLSGLGEGPRPGHRHRGSRPPSRHGAATGPWGHCEPGKRPLLLRAPPRPSREDEDIQTWTQCSRNTGDRHRFPRGLAPPACSAVVGSRASPQVVARAPCPQVPAGTAARAVQPVRARR